jgi:hypothetical protein
MEDITSLINMKLDSIKVKKYMISVYYSFNFILALHQAKNLIQAENQVNLSKSTINTNFYK